MANILIRRFAFPNASCKAHIWESHLLHAGSNQIFFISLVARADVFRVGTGTGFAHDVTRLRPPFRIEIALPNHLCE